MPSMAIVSNEFCRDSSGWTLPRQRRAPLTTPSFLATGGGLLTIYHIFYLLLHFVYGAKPLSPKNILFCPLSDPKRSAWTPTSTSPHGKTSNASSLRSYAFYFSHPKFPHQTPGPLRGVNLTWQQEETILTLLIPKFLASPSPTSAANTAYQNTLTARPPVGVTRYTRIVLALYMFHPIMMHRRM